MKRKRQGGHARSSSKRVNVIDTSSDANNLEPVIEDELLKTRQILLKLFLALESCLLSTLSLSTYHSVERAVTNSARHEFTLERLAQIQGVWPDAYRLEPAMALYNGSRVPSISILRPTSTIASAVSNDRRHTFEMQLPAWYGRLGALPAMEHKTLMPLNAAKITSIQRDHKEIQTSSIDELSSAKDRQSALRERVRAKALDKASGPTDEDRNNATIAALVPNVVTSIKILLASRRTKSIGLVELVDNLVTSMNNRVGVHEVRKIVEYLSRSDLYGNWCRMGQVGGVYLVKFVGDVPRL